MKVAKIRDLSAVRTSPTPHRFQWSLLIQANICQALALTATAACPACCTAVILSFRAVDKGDSAMLFGWHVTECNLTWTEALGSAGRRTRGQILSAPLPGLMLARYCRARRDETRQEIK